MYLEVEELVKLGAEVERAMLAVQVVDGCKDAAHAGVAGMVGGALERLQEAQGRLAREIGLKMMAAERGATP